MTKTIPVGFGEAAIVLTGAPGTQPFVTTIGVSLVGVDPATYVDAANLVLDEYIDALAGSTSNALTIDQVVLSVGLAGGVSGSVVSDHIGVVGTNTEPMAAVAMAAIARKQSAELGRRGRGRAFLPGVLTDASVDIAGNITNTYAVAIAAQYNDFLTALAAAPVGSALAPVILHADGSTPTPITGATVAEKVGWVRGRIR